MYVSKNGAEVLNISFKKGNNKQRKQRKQSRSDYLQCFNES